MLFYCRQLSSCSSYDNYVSVVRDADSDTDDAMFRQHSVPVWQMQILGEAPSACLTPDKTTCNDTNPKSTSGLNFGDRMLINN